MRIVVYSLISHNAFVREVQFLELTVEISLLTVSTGRGILVLLHVRRKSDVAFRMVHSLS